MYEFAMNQYNRIDKEIIRILLTVIYIYDFYLVNNIIDKWKKR